MKLKNLIFLITTSLILLTGCTNRDGSGKSGQITLNVMNEKELKIDYANGEIKKFKNLKIEGTENKIVFLNFFSTTCAPCRSEIPSLVSLQNKYKDDFKVIGILVENKALSDVKEFAKDFNINYIVTDTGENRGATNLVGGVSAIPAMYMYDKSGKYFTHYIGAVPLEMIENDIKRVLGL